jgi:hypothetical protein
MIMEGLVKTAYANPSYMKNCQTPITSAIDDLDVSEITCLDIENAGQCKFHTLFHI